MKSTYFTVTALVLFVIFLLWMSIVPLAIIFGLVKLLVGRGAVKQSGAVKRRSALNARPKVPPAGKGLMVTGLVFICIGVLLFAMCLPVTMLYLDGGATVMSSALLMFIAFGLPGIPAAIVGGRRQKFLTKYTRYTAMVAAPGEYSLDELAASYPAMYNRTCADLQALIYGAYIPNAYLDLQARKLVCLPAGPQAVSEEKPPAVPEEAKQAVINCPNCGCANAVIEGKITGCEYCGSTLTA